MNLYDKILLNKNYLDIVHEIENTRFITDGKWDFDHGLGHYKRVAQYAQNFLEQLGEDARTIELSRVASLLHDIGLIKKNKVDHAILSSKLFYKFLDDGDVSEEEKEILRQAIEDHSNGKNINSMVGLSLLLADKLDVTYQRVETSSIHDYINNEFAKIKKVWVDVSDFELTLNYVTENDFDLLVLNNWIKAITIPQKVAHYLGKDFIFKLNGQIIDINIKFSF